MKRLLLGLALAATTAAPTLAGSIAFDLPRLSFPGQGGEVTRACSDLVQSSACAETAE